MQEYYRLQQTLLFVSLGLTATAFASVWWAYSLAIALNYLLGACVGIAYLRRLAKDVEGLGRGNQRLGMGRLALFAGAIILAIQLPSLQVLPVFLGFMTYKAAVLAYTIETALQPRSD